MTSLNCICFLQYQQSLVKKISAETVHILSHIQLKLTILPLEQDRLSKGTIFWDIKLCGLLKVNQGFKGTYSFHLQGQRICWVLNKMASWAQSWRWRRYVPPKCQLTFNRLHGVYSILQNHYCENLKSYQLPCWLIYQTIAGYLVPTNKYE
jgi:hypothetical protein